MLPTAIALTAALAGAACEVTSPPRQVALVELYTSQGCSSCPPADRWLGTLHDRYGERVVPLSLHVGYWDYIGWKDPFARREFNERQRLLAAANGSRTVYTPGVFVQGRELSDWSRGAALDAAIEAAQRRPAQATLTLRVESIMHSDIGVRLQASAPAGARLWLALVESGITTRVKAGENRGETLRNDHVVRDWHGPFAPGASTQTLVLPAGVSDASDGRWAIVALADDARGSTYQAVRLPLAGCRQP